MPTETEELRLVITLTDNASAGLRALKQQHAELGSGATSGHIESFKRKHGELAKQIKEMSELATGGEKAMLGFVGKFGVAGAAVVGFTTVVLAGISSLTKYSDKMNDLNNKAKVMGVHPAVLKSIEEQLERVGISAEVADQNVAKFNEAYAKMGRVGSIEHQNLVNKAGRFGSDMEAGIQKILRQKDEVARINETLAQAENVKANRLKENNGNIADATQFYREFLAEWGLDPEFALVKSLKEVEDREKAIFDQRQKATGEYKKAIVDLKHEWDDWMDDVRSSVLSSDGLIVTGLKEAITLTKFLHDMWDKPLVKEVAKGTGEAMSFMIPGVNTIKFWKWIGDLYNSTNSDKNDLGDALGKNALPSAEGGAAKAVPLLSQMGENAEDHMDSMRENTGELKRLNDYFTREQMGKEGYAAGAATRSQGTGPTAATGSGGSTGPSGSQTGGSYGPAPAAPGGGATPAGQPAGGAGSSAAQQAAERTFGTPSFGTPGRGALKGDLGLDQFTRGTPAMGVLGGDAAGAAAQETGGGSLAEQRKPLMDEVRADPETKQRLHQMMKTEGGGARTVEALFNRVSMIRKKVPGYTISDELKSGFYGPMRPGGRGPRTSISPSEAAQFDKTLDRVVGGSNLIHGRTNQGMPSDPGAGLPGRVAAPGGEVYNYWEGQRKGAGFSVSDSANFAQEEERLAATRATVDAKSIKTVKVDASGKVAVNIGGGNDNTLASNGLFRPTSPERQTQMQAATVGPDAPANFNERFTGTND